MRRTSLALLALALAAIVARPAGALIDPNVPDVIGGCPSEAITRTVAHAHPLGAAHRAAAAYAHNVLGWQTASVLSVYRVGTTNATGLRLGAVFARQVPRWCGKAVAHASFGVELTNPSDPDSGTDSRAALVVAHFASGWRVWGRFYF